MNNKEEQKIAVIAGAGPAGLTAGYELLEKTDIKPIIFECSDTIGGISQTVCYKGNRMDIGGHRFFSKSKRVTDFWDKIMPLQGKPSQDDILIGREKEFVDGGPDPEHKDRVMLIRERVSRIYYLRKFFDYPISLKMKTFTNMGVIRTVKAGLGYIKSAMVKKEENSLEDFYINRFGKPLYNMFFEDYTEKVWGIHPSKLGADWGAQRVKGLSIFSILKNMLSKSLGTTQKEVETSLIESFIYPKLGPGQLWECTAQDIQEKGGVINLNAPVSKVHVKDNRVDYVEIGKDDGTCQKIQCDYFLSSMPIKDLIKAIDGIQVPNEVKEIAQSLPYRDFITVGLLVKDLKITNQTSIKTYKNRIPDTWIYIQERDVKIGRLQVFNNWSPYLVKDYENSIWLGLEYFCTEGDELWEMEEEKFINMAIEELTHIGLIKKEDVIDSHRVRIKKAYPSYYGSYYKLDTVKEFLDSIDNLFCIGRNGQHRYNNMDHSMLTAMMTIDHIKNGNKDKSSIWAVNTEEEYHEAKKNEN